MPRKCNILRGITYKYKNNIMELESNKKKLQLFNEIYSYTNGMAILTGSLALMMQNELPERVASDIDIILPYYFDLSTFGKVERFNNPYSTVSFAITNSNCAIHVIIDPTCQYNTIYDNGRLLKLSNIQDIWIEKFRSFILFDTEKNCKDLNELIQKNLSKKAQKNLLDSIS